MTRSTSVALCCVGLVACTFDPSGYQPTGAGGSTATTGATGAGSTTDAGTSTSAAATSSSASNATSSGATTTSSSGSGSTTGATGTGGGPMALAPCGGFTDPFDNFPTSPAWNTHNANRVVDGGNKLVETKISGIDIWAGAWLANASYQDCYASIELLDQSGGRSYLNLYEDIGHNTEIHYDDGSRAIGAPGASTILSDRPSAMAIAFLANKVYYLYMPHGSTTWTKLDTQQRSSWMDNGPTDALGFGVDGIVGNWAKFDNFNVDVVTTGDL